MNLNDEEQAVYERIKTFAEEKGYALNPDGELVERVVRGLVKRKEKAGEYYCPCRMTTGKPEADRKIICPCDYHEEELREKGICHCRLLIDPNHPAQASA